MNDKLKEQGWYLSEDGLKKCIELSGQKEPAVAKIISVALKQDLRHIAERYMPENINSGHVASINGPFVVQLQKIRNVSAPTVNQDSQGAPRMLKMNFTDGIMHCVAIEFQAISCLKMSTIPGTKFCITGKNIPISHGVLFLEEKNIKALGGDVDKLKEKWGTSQSLKKSTKKRSEAPQFEEFNPDKYKRRSPRYSENKKEEETSTIGFQQNDDKQNNHGDKSKRNHEQQSEKQQKQNKGSQVKVGKEMIESSLPKFKEEETKNEGNAARNPQNKGYDQRKSDQSNNYKESTGKQVNSRNRDRKQEENEKSSQEKYKSASSKNGKEPKGYENKRYQDKNEKQYRGADAGQQRQNPTVANKYSKEQHSKSDGYPDKNPPVANKYSKEQHSKSDGYPANKYSKEQHSKSDGYPDKKYSKEQHSKSDAYPDKNFKKQENPRQQQSAKGNYNGKYRKEENQSKHQSADTESGDKKFKKQENQPRSDSAKNEKFPGNPSENKQQSQKPSKEKTDQQSHSKLVKEDGHERSSLKGKQNDGKSNGKGQFRDGGRSRYDEDRDYYSDKQNGTKSNSKGKNENYGRNKYDDDREYYYYDDDDDDDDSRYYDDRRTGSRGKQNWNDKKESYDKYHKETGGSRSNGAGGGYKDTHPKDKQPYSKQKDFKGDGTKTTEHQGKDFDKRRYDNDRDYYESRQNNTKSGGKGRNQEFQRGRYEDKIDYYDDDRDYYEDRKSGKKGKQRDQAPKQRQEVQNENESIKGGFYDEEIVANRKQKRFPNKNENEKEKEGKQYQDGNKTTSSQYRRETNNTANNQTAVQSDKRKSFPDKKNDNLVSPIDKLLNNKLTLTETSASPSSNLLQQHSVQLPNHQQTFAQHQQSLAQHQYHPQQPPPPPPPGLGNVRGQHFMPPQQQPMFDQMQFPYSHPYQQQFHHQQHMQMQPQNMAGNPPFLSMQQQQQQQQQQQFFYSQYAHYQQEQ